MTDIFVSYAHEDQERVRPIVTELEKRGWHVFWDRIIPVAETWESSIGKALEESRCVLVAWSRYSKDSDWVKEEADIAKKKGILVPLLLDDIEQPIGFGRIQAANLTDWQNNSAHQVFRQLISAIESKISSSTPPVLESTKAPEPEPVSAQVPAQTSANIPPNPNLNQQPERNRKESQFAKSGKQQVVIAFTLVLLFILFIAGLMRNKNESVSSGVPAFVAPVASVEAQSNFILIRGGDFMMGSPSTEPDRGVDEGPQHSVRLSDFYMSKYALTVAEFRRFVEATGYRTEAEKENSSQIWHGSIWVDKAGVNWRYGVSGSIRPQSEDNHPVVHVSWNDAVAYCKWMTETTGKTYRLPTEAEREYACRGGTITPFNTGENLTTEQANYNGNYPYNNNQTGVYRGNTLPVNSFAPNAFGLYNMHGNVHEWCSDWYGQKYYEECKAKGTVENPAGPETGSYRVLRGGGWFIDAMSCRSAYRCGNHPDDRGSFAGFRLVFVP